MFRKRQVGLFVGAIFVAMPARADDRAQPTQKITFDQAIAQARRQAPGLTTTRARIGEAVAQVDAATVWRFNPELAARPGPRW